MNIDELKKAIAIGNHFQMMAKETEQGINLQKNLESCKIAIENVDNFIKQYQKGDKDYKAWVDVRKNYHWLQNRILDKMP